MKTYQVGDKVTVNKKGFDGQVAYWDGEVIAIYEKFITCKVTKSFNFLSIEKFDPKTGINIEGRDSGWLDVGDQGGDE